MMRRYVTSPSQLLCLGVAALVVAVLLLMPATRLSTSQPALAAPGDPTMTVDADPTMPGIQATRSVSGTFSISLEATDASAVAGYQWELQFTDSVLNFVSATENTAGTGATICTSPTQHSPPPSKEWWYGGCVRPSGTMPAAVRLVTITLSCASIGATELHLVTGGDEVSGEDPSFGSIFIQPGGATLPTNRYDASITCVTGYIVNSTGDAPDNNVSDGICNDGTGSCTLRAAIQQSNAYIGPNKIGFSLPTYSTIAPLSQLPSITEQVIIDGTTASPPTNLPVIEIRGDSIPGSGGWDGLQITGGTGTVLRGLVIDRFSGNGVYIAGPGGNTISKSNIGTDFTSTTDVGNGAVGVQIVDSPNNTIGGTAPSDGDAVLISGNNVYGVQISGSSASGNTLTFVGIGVNGATTGAIPNSAYGVLITGAPNNTINGAVISGNGGAGVVIAGAGASGNVVRSAGIGTDRFGATAVGNNGPGVMISGAPNNTIGISNAPTEGNLISGNAFDGVEIVGSGATGNLIQGNAIGTNGAGTAAMPNGGNAGVDIQGGAANNTVGGAVAGKGNLISGNLGDGVSIFGGTGHQVLGNHIGTNLSGTAAIANGGRGVWVGGSAINTTIGSAIGTTPDAGCAGGCNLISGNTSWGIWLEGGATSGTQIVGDRIGLNFAGTATIANGAGGVRIWTAPSTTIGGTSSGARNVISGNGSTGVSMDGPSAAQLLGNFIGTDVTGSAGLPNTGDGVKIFNGASGATVGNTSGGANVIAYNGGHGVLIDGAGGSVSANHVRGNSIHDNGGLGIRLLNGANGGIVSPTITPDASGNLTGSPSGTACANCIVDVFSDNAEEGRLRQGSVTASASGTWTSTLLIAGPNVTATATNVSGNTSEFSTPLAVKIVHISGTPNSPGYIDGAPASAKPVNGPHGLYKTANNDLYFADTGNNVVRKISPNTPGGTVSTVAGGGTGSCGTEINVLGDNCPAANAILSGPYDVFVDAGENIYIADTGNCRVRKVDAALPHRISTVAGTGISGSNCDDNGDGPVAFAHLNHPRGVAVDNGGIVYIADMDNNKIRKVVSASVTTFAGTGAPGYADQVSPTAAQLDHPQDVYWALGAVTIADTGNQRVRRAGPGDFIQTIAGNGSAGPSPDGIPAISASLHDPVAIAVEANGSTLIADSLNHKLRRVNPQTGIISTVAGNGTAGTGTEGDNGNPLNAELNTPSGVAAGSATESEPTTQTLRGFAAAYDPTGRPPEGYATITSCSVSLNHIKTADWLLPLLPLGMIAGRRRFGRFLIRLGSLASLQGTHWRIRATHASASLDAVSRHVERL